MRKSNINEDIPLMTIIPWFLVIIGGVLGYKYYQKEEAAKLGYQLASIATQNFQEREAVEISSFEYEEQGVQVPEAFKVGFNDSGCYSNHQVPLLYHDDPNVLLSAYGCLTRNLIEGRKARFRLVSNIK